MGGGFATTFFLSNIITTIAKLTSADNKKGIVELPWCGSEDCALEIENILEGNTLGEPAEIEKLNDNLVCPVCGKPAMTWMRYAKTY